MSELTTTGVDLAKHVERSIRRRTSTSRRGLAILRSMTAASELVRVAAPGAAFLLSMPLHPSHWCLPYRRKMAMWWYKHVLMPFGVRLQRKPSLVSGMVGTVGVDEVPRVRKQEPALRRKL